MDNLQLYSAYSKVGSFSNRDVTIQWIKVDHQYDNYHSLIVDYDNLTDEERYCSRQRIDELFIESECGLILEYLYDSHNADVSFSEVALPIRARGDSGHIIMPVSEMALNGFQIELWEEEACNLPFCMAGVFMLAG